MKKLIAKFLISLLLLVSAKGQDFTEKQRNYSDSILQLAIQDRIQTFDTLFNPIPVQALLGRYCRYDTVINCQWTRPRFIDNIYHHSFDGISVKIGRPPFDTITSANHIAFQEHIYDDYGNFKKIETVFLIKRNAKPLTPAQAKDKVLEEIKTKLSDQKYIDLISTTSNEFWTNSEIEIKNSKYSLDSCQLNYHLELSPNHEFEQTYGYNDTSCFTSQMDKDVDVGVEGNPTTFFSYNNKVQYCKIENRTGYWTVNSDNLILFSMYGQDILRFKITNITKDSLGLEINDYKVKLKRIASR